MEAVKRSVVARGLGRGREEQIGEGQLIVKAVKLLCVIQQ